MTVCGWLACDGCVAQAYETHKIVFLSFDFSFLFHTGCHVIMHIVQSWSVGRQRQK